jgi:hypothetical protein
MILKDIFAEKIGEKLAFFIFKKAKLCKFLSGLNFQDRQHNFLEANLIFVGAGFFE